MPAITTELGGLGTYGWAVSALMLASVTGTVVGGYLADRHGPRTPYIVGFAVFTVGLVVAAPSPAWWVFLLGRVVQGLGMGAVMSMAYVVVAENASWRWLFVLLVPFVLVAVTVTLRGLPDIPGGGRAAGVVRQLVFSTGLAVSAGVFLAGLEQSRAAVLVPMVILGGAVMVWTLRLVTPDGTLNARRGVPAGIATRGVLSMSFFGIETFLPLAMTDLRGTGLTFASVALAAGAMSGTIQMAQTLGTATIAGVGTALIAATQDGAGLSVGLGTVFALTAFVALAAIPLAVRIRTTAPTSDINETNKG